MKPLSELYDEHVEREAFSWVQKDDGSLGHCPECFKAGANSAKPLILELVECLGMVDAVGMPDPYAKIVKEALQKLRKELGG